MKVIEINGVKRECYPLLPAQKLHFYTVKAINRPEVLNIGTGLYVQFDTDFEVLRWAINEARKRHECSRLQFHQEADGSMWQYVIPYEEQNFDLHDYRNWNENDVHSRFNEYTRYPFEMFDHQLNRITMVRMPGGYNGIYMNVQHMTMDSSAMFLFLRDVIVIYCSKMYPDAASYPPPMTSYIECLKKDLEYEGSKANERDKKYWTEFFSQPEPIYTDFAGEGRLIRARLDSGNPNKRSAGIVSDNCNAQISVYHLEEEPSNKLMDFCSEHNVPIVCMLLMGLRTTLSIFNGNEKDISIKTTVARRGTKLETYSGGTRIHYFPFRTIIEPTETFLDGLRIIQAAQNAIFRHANIDPVMLTMQRNKMFGLAPHETYESIALTYQPMSASSEEKKALPAKYQSFWYSNGVAAQPLYLTVMHRPNDNGLDFYFEHQGGVVSKEELDVLYYYICRVMFRGMENFDKPIETILQFV